MTTYISGSISLYTIFFFVLQMHVYYAKFTDAEHHVTRPGLLIGCFSPHMNLSLEFSYWNLSGRFKKTSRIPGVLKVGVTGQ